MSTILQAEQNVLDAVHQGILQATSFRINSHGFNYQLDRGENYQVEKFEDYPNMIFYISFNFLYFRYLIIGFPCTRVL